MLTKTRSTIEKGYDGKNVCLVGNPKVGKSTFASQLGDSVYFAATEAGHKFLEVYKSDINKFQDFEQLVNDLLTEKHPFTTLVIDVFDKLYELAQDEICVRNKVKSISDVPFGAGYSAARKLITSNVLKLNQKKIGVTFITHSKEKEIKQDAVTWNAVATSMPDSVEKEILAMCDFIFFCYSDKDGKRLIRTKPNKFVTAAGDRSKNLPEIMPLDAKLVLEEMKK